MILGDNTYYVSSSTTDDCPRPCHPLSYYITDTATYFTSNATFIFMEGEHLLDSKGLVQVVINNVDNLTLRGESGHSNTDIIIRCGSNTHGLEFNDGSIINIYGITITGCGQQDMVPLTFTNIASLYIHHILLYNNIYSTSNDTAGGALYIHSISDTDITIINSTFISNIIAEWGGGLHIQTGTDTHNNITITNSAFTGNIGGGLYIFIDTGTHNDITIGNSAFTNNRVDFDGGGLYIYTGTDAHNNSITITDSKLTSNTVYGNGSGLYIYTGNGTHNSVTITNSVLINNIAYGDGGGLYIYTGNGTHNSVTITNSISTRNIVHGDGGGLYIYTGNGTDNSVTITNSASISNIVNGSGGGLYIYTGNTNDRVGGDGGVPTISTTTNTHNNITITDNMLINIIVYGDGGGLSICNVNGTHNSVTITNNAFTFNEVGIDGGGLYIYTGTNTHNNITITNSTFTNNNVYGGSGGGLFIYTLYLDTHNNIAITNSVFTYNRVGYGGGGGVHIHTSDNEGTDNIAITNSAFTNNKTTFAGGGLYIHSANRRNNITITNSIFTNNSNGVVNGKGDGLHIVIYTDIDNCITIANSTFANNRGSGILIKHHITLNFTEGHSIVANNSSPTEGGGISLGKDCYLTTSNGGHVSFINNTAHRYGGAIYSVDNDYTSLRYNGDIYEYHSDQCTVHNLSATFINNSAARAGDRLYGGVFTLCKDNFYHGYNNYLQHLIKCNTVPDILNYNTSVHPLSPVSSDPIAVCPCVNGVIDCNTTALDKRVYPGQIFNVSLVTVGLCGGISPGTVAVKHDKQINLISSTIDYTATTCTTLNYTVKLTNYNIPNTTIPVTINIADGDIYGITPISVNLTILLCPLGLVVNFALGYCVCNNDITHLSGVICNTSWMPYPIQRSGNNWISYQYGKESCTIAHIGCPFDYCNTSTVKLNLNESDLQCNYNRSGILCGQCIQGLSLMIGSNRCANCTDTKLVSVSIVILAAVAGVVLVILLMLLNLTVSVGSINGLLFYANLVKLNESVFFSSGNIPVITQFISWCNLDMGFEYCFVDGLDGYVKMWLQLVFPLYVWFLVIVIILGC